MATQLSRTVALRRRLVKIHESRRLKKAVSYLKEDIARHTKSNYDSIRLTGELNGYLMHEVAKHMSNVSVVITKDAEMVKVDLTPELKKTRIKPIQHHDLKDDKSASKKADSKKSQQKSESTQPESKKPSKPAKETVEKKAVPTTEKKAPQQKSVNTDVGGVQQQ